MNLPPSTEIHALSLHDALPISLRPAALPRARGGPRPGAGRHAPAGAHPLASLALVRGRGTPHLAGAAGRSEEHTSELQSHSDLVCRLLLEKKKYDHQECTKIRS